MLNQVLLLYYPTRHTWLTLHTIVSVVLCRINLLTPTRSIATVLAVLVGLTQQMEQGEMEELGMRRSPQLW